MYNFRLKRNYVRPIIWWYSMVLCWGVRNNQNSWKQNLQTEPKTYTTKLCSSKLPPLIPKRKLLLLETISVRFTFRNGEKRMYTKAKLIVSNLTPQNFPLNTQMTSIIIIYKALELTEFWFWYNIIFSRKCFGNKWWHTPKTQLIKPCRVRNSINYINLVLDCEQIFYGFMSYVLICIHL